MTDKVQKIKDWISKEQDGLMDAQGNFGYPEHEGAYHILCNLDTYIDSLQEERVSGDFEMALTEMIDKAQKCVVEPIVVAQQWKDYLVELAKSEKPVSEELKRASKEWLKPQLDKSYESYGECKMMELTHFDGYAMLDAIEFGAKWQKLQDMGITNNRAQDVVANLLSSADNPLDAYATEVAFMMLPATLKESYHQTNRDRIGDAVRLGAKWQKEKDNEERVLTYKHGFEDCKEQMMTNAIDAEIVNTDTHLKLYTNLDTSKETQSKNCGRCKVIIIKEE